MARPQKSKTAATKPTATKTRSQRDATAEALANPGPSSRINWTTGETTQLIKFLAAHRSEAGDGMNFKLSVFQAASESTHVCEPPEGTPKEGWVPPVARDTLACKNKWAAVRH